MARRSELVVGRESHLVVELSGMGVEGASVRSVVLRAKVATAAVALDGMARLAAEVCALISQGRVGRHRALSHMAITVATKATKGHLVRWLLQARRRSATASRGLRDRSRRVGGGGHSVVVVRIGDRDGSRVADVRSAVSHGGRVVAKLDARLGTANGATIGDVAARAVGSHGDGAFSKMIGAGAVERAAGDGRDCGRNGLFAVYWRRR